MKALCLTWQTILIGIAYIWMACAGWQVVVNMHRPIYTSSASGLDPSSVIRVAEDLRGALEPVFFMYQVECKTESNYLEESWHAQHS